MTLQLPKKTILLSFTFARMCFKKNAFLTRLLVGATLREEKKKGDYRVLCSGRLVGYSFVNWLLFEAEAFYVPSRHG